LPCLRINGRGDRRYRRNDLARFMKNAAAGAAVSAAPAGGRGRRSEPPTLTSEVSERSRRADLLLAMGTELGRQLDPNLVLSQLVERTVELFKADRGAVFTRTTAGTYRAVAKLNLSDDYCQALEHATSRPVAAIAYEEKRVVSIPDIADDLRLSEMRLAFVREGINTATVAPLMFDGEPMGVLSLYFDSHHEWTRDDLELLTSIAEQGAMVVRNAQNYNRMATWAAQLHSIQQLGTRLTRLRTVNEIGQMICTELNQLIACHNIRVYRVEGEDCVPVAWRGEVGEYVTEDGDALRLHVGEGITGWVARHGLAQMLGDAAADKRTQTIPGTDDNMDESLLLAPMLFDDEVIGVIVLAKLGLNQFGPDDLRVLEIYASIAAQALANADATERLRAQSETLVRQLNSQRELLRVTESILTTLDAQTLLEEIATRLQSLIHFDNIAVSVHDSASRRLRTIFARGVNADEFLALDTADDVGLGGDAIGTGEAQLIQDELTDPRVRHFDSLGPQPGALIVAPLRSGEGIQGLLTIERLGGDAHFTSEEFDLVKLFAAHVSIALRNAAAHRAVELRAETDPLTGLWNHGSLTQQIDRLVELRGRFSMLMVDLDFFKRYNDNLGHQAGNSMLQQVAQVLRDSCRDSDLVFRFGGDEFAVLLPSTGLAGARIVADKIHTAVSTMSDETQSAIDVRCSVGIAVYPKDGHDGTSIIIAADRACYAAKRAGRDRIAVAAEGLALATDFRPTEPTPIEAGGRRYSAA
jgi:diguanylate cyclase (GGDEF)-like protein